MKAKCSVCNETIVGHEPYVEIQHSRRVYHTCNINSRGNSCYQEWLDEKQKKKVPVNDLCDMSPSNI